jgi:hypothetical protein
VKEGAGVWLTAVLGIGGSPAELFTAGVPDRPSRMMIRVRDAGVSGSPSFRRSVGVPQII